MIYNQRWSSATLTQLQSIVAVTQERHFDRAAEKAFVTQPALSLAIKNLEEELGTTIFERRQARIELTALGKQIVHQSPRVLEEVEQIQNLSAQGKDQLNGLLRLGVIATVGPYILQDWVPLFSSRAPKMPLELEENLTQNLVGMLKNGKLDVIIIALPLDEAGILTTALYDEPFQVPVPITHPWRKKKMIDSTKLASQNHRRHSQRRPFREDF